MNAREGLFSVLLLTVSLNRVLGLTTLGAEWKPRNLNSFQNNDKLSIMVSIFLSGN